MKPFSKPNQSIQQFCNTYRLNRGLRYPSLLALALLFLVVAPLPAADVTWNNAASTSQWNLTDTNWSTGVWNNAGGDGAIFDATGAGAINVTTPINVNSLGFTAGGYVLNGTGPLNIVAGTSSLGTRNVYVNTGLTVAIDTPSSTAFGLTKMGQGILQLSEPITFAGFGLSLTAATNILPVDIFAGGQGGISPTQYSGTTQIMNTSVLPATTRLGISNGLFDFGALNIVLGSITFYDDTDIFAFDPTTNTAKIGITGTGTLSVTGEINVLGNQFGFNLGSNSIAPNLDFGGGTQIIRVSNATLQNQWGALQMMGVLSNGSLLKTLSYNQNGVMANGDGIGLFANNTYTGSTRIGGGFNAATGTNASSSVEVFGNATALSLQGANGSYLSATTIQAFSGAIFQIDNNASIGGVGNFSPTIPAAQNNDRLADDAALQQRDGNFTYRGQNNVAASETIGSLSVLGGNNLFTINTGGTGTATFTVAGDLTMAARSTLTLSSTSLSVNDRVFVNGTLPAPDATGILPRIVQTTDFLTYNGGTGFTPYTGYSTDFNTVGTNVSTTGAATVTISNNVNAVKSANSGTTTITAGQTLGVTSGMMLSASGTRTYTGGTIAFGSNPGAFFGSNTINSAISGNAGLLNATGTLTLSGDLSGLSGTITQNGFGTTTLANTSTGFTGAFEVREGTFNINTSLSAGGAITLGVSANDADMVGAVPLLSISGAGANATIARDIIVDNGSLTNAGVALGNSFMVGFSPLSNTTGSQTVSGNITLNSPLRIQGGGAGGTGSTNFTGNIAGPASIRVVNGRVAFSGNYSNANGFWLGETGTNTQVTFNGTAGGTAPLVINGTNNNSFIAYTSGALPTGLISTNNTNTSGLAFLTPLDSSTINNNFVLNGVGYLINPPSSSSPVAGSGSVGANIGSGISSIWAGQMSGAGGLVKSGAGTLTLSNASNTYTGTTTISAGVLLVNGDTSGSLMNITGGTLGGTGPVGGITAANGSVAPGNSTGLLTSVGNVTFNTGTTFKIEIGGLTAGTEYDRLQVTGTVNLGAGVTTLSGSLINGFAPEAGQQFTIIQCTGGITGTFAQGSSVNIGGTDFAIAYNANSVVLSVPASTPTPTAAPTETPTPAPTETPTPAPTPTATATATATPTVTISGTAVYCSNPSLNPVPGVTMTLTGTTGGSATTDGVGDYSFTGLTSGGNYTVTPTKAALPPGSGGITTVDVVAIQRHFLNIALIPPGCPLTAADVNANSIVDTSDVIAVQRFVLGMSTGLANVGKYNFSPAIRTYPSLLSDQTSQNYDVLVFGDVASGFVHRSGGVSSDMAEENQIAQTISSVALPEMAVDESRKIQGGAVTVSVIDAKDKLVGFQGDITFDERVVTFPSQPVQKAGLTRGNWNVSGNVLPGTGPTRTLRVSAYSNDFTPLSGSGTLFELRMTMSGRGRQSAPLSWAESPNQLIFIDADLKTQRPGKAAPGSVTTSGKRR